MAKKKILVVDDSPTELRLITSLLREHGYEVLVAADGEDALDKALHDRPQLIVLDVILPKKNGFQVCRQLKTSPVTKEIRILMLTSKTLDSDRYWGLRQGAEAYMTKPFSDSELLAQVSELLSRTPEPDLVTEVNPQSVET
jgi:twitching motility two-component system response regulator PilH